MYLVYCPEGMLDRSPVGEGKGRWGRKGVGRGLAKAVCFFLFFVCFFSFLFFCRKELSGTADVGRRAEQQDSGGR